MAYFYPRSPCGERLNSQSHELHNTNFYPRSPCGERQVVYYKILYHLLFLSTLSLRRATLIASPSSLAFLFLSTLSLRRATYLINTYHRIFGEDFYPRSPCGERRFVRCRFWVLSNISIHALLAESDAVPLESYFLHSLFLSTLSLRRATVHVSAACADYHISIHALLAESDVVAADKLHDFPKFLSTLSLRRAT